MTRSFARSSSAGLSALVLALLYGPLQLSAQDRQTDGLIRIATPQGQTILAELANTTQTRAKGLMFREALPNGRGMLFTFSEPQPWTFWMKNTRIPLDIVWMDRQKRIVHVERNVPGCSRQDDGCPQYQPSEDALYVLEVAAGQSEVLQLTRGVKLQFDLTPMDSTEPSGSVPSR